MAMQIEQKLVRTRDATSLITSAAWLRTPAAAAYLGFSAPTLEKWRWEGKGPKFYKIGGHAVGYKLSDLEAFAEAASYQSTSEYPAPADAA